MPSRMDRNPSGQLPVVLAVSGKRVEGEEKGPSPAGVWRGGLKGKEGVEAKDRQRLLRRPRRSVQLP
jgi:hypothetical protein